MSKKVRIEYLLSEEGRKKSLLAGGDGKRIQIIEADLSPEIIERATVYQDGTAVWEIDYLTTDAEIVGTYNFDSFRLEVCNDFYANHKPNIRNKANNIYFDEIQTAESLLSFVKGLEAKVASKIVELEAELPEKITLWEKGVTEHKQRAAEALAREAEAKAREAEAKAREEKERADWIAAHGSDFLKRATKLGYNCQRQYVTERAEFDFPTFTIDFDDCASWKTRSCPSEDALAKVEGLISLGYVAEVVWLTKPYECEYIDPYDPYDKPFKPCEAIVIHDYLNKYNLVKII